MLHLKISLEPASHKALVSRLRKKSTQFNKATAAAIDKRTQNLYTEVLANMSTGSKAVRFPSGRTNSNAFMGTTAGEIGIHTGRLSSNLAKSFNGAATVMRGEVGYSKGLSGTLPSGARQARIDWPSNANTSTEYRSLPPSSYQPDEKEESLQDYIKQVLLGTTKLFGRNVLRLALSEDIARNKTFAAVRNALRGVMKG